MVFVLFCFSGVHRQVLLTTVGWFLGYYLTKYENYMNAKLDRDVREYIKQHPEDFAPKGQWLFCVYLCLINTLLT